MTASGQDVVRLSEYLRALKARFPDKTNATLLVAEDVDYDTIVQVMDAVRVRQSVRRRQGRAHANCSRRSRWETRPT